MSNSLMIWKYQVSCSPIEPGYGLLHLLHIQPKKGLGAATGPGLRLIMFHRA